MPTASERLEERLIELEIKASYAEDLLDELNRLVARQQDRIDQLLREVAALREGGTPSEAIEPRDPRGDLPPHY